jgi:hypothetical protein
VATAERKQRFLQDVLSAASADARKRKVVAAHVALRALCCLLSRFISIYDSAIVIQPYPEPTPSNNVAALHEHVGTRPRYSAERLGAFSTRRAFSGKGIGELSEVYDSIFVNA